MDDGFTPLPREINQNDFLELLNSMHPNIKYTMEAAKTNRGSQQMNFLDIVVILKNDSKLETDIYYKSTNTHDYLDYNSFHPSHCKNNIPYNLAKRIVVFVTDQHKMHYRLNQLSLWLRRCNYPQNVINKAFHNAKLQGPAPQPASTDNILPLVTSHISNYSLKSFIPTITSYLKNINNEELRQKFQNTSIVLGLKQPPNLLRTLTHARFESIPRPTPTNSNGLYKICSSRCKLCQLYIQEGDQFLTSNGTVWHIRCHINCNSTNVLYYLSCNYCHGHTTYIGKTSTSLRIRTNNHISDIKTGNTHDKFDLHVRQCSNLQLTEPFFKLYALMTLKDSSKLLIYERKYHKLKYDSMN